MTQIQNINQNHFGHFIWRLVLIWNLVFVIWNLGE